jgi:hypothetical protein
MSRCSSHVRRAVAWKTKSVNVLSPTPFVRSEPFGMNDSNLRFTVKARIFQSPDIPHVMAPEFCDTRIANARRGQFSNLW